MVACNGLWRHRILRHVAPLQFTGSTNTNREKAQGLQNTKTMCTTIYLNSLSYDEIRRTTNLIWALPLIVCYEARNQGWVDRVFNCSTSSQLVPPILTSMAIVPTTLPLSNHGSLWMNSLTCQLITNSLINLMDQPFYIMLPMHKIQCIPHQK